jgi:cytidylate kinase
LKSNIIAIDGPAASGKSTLGKKLADDLGYLYFDTGVMYRAITWAAINKGIDPGDEEKVTSLAESVEIEILPSSSNDGRDNDILLDGEDITWEIRRPEVDSNVSVVSAFPGVRTALTSQQRRIGRRGKVIMVGRDIGTVVLPDADIKIFLDASVKERSQRRYLEIMGRGGNVKYQDVFQMMIKRDKIDSTRDVAPLCAADDAVVIDSDKLTQEEVLDKVRKIIERLS